MNIFIHIAWECHIKKCKIHCFLAVFFGCVLANYVNFVPVSMSKWLIGPYYVENELRSGILEVKHLQKELLVMTVLLLVMKL